MGQKIFNNINEIRKGPESTRVIIAPKSVKPHRCLFVNNLHHRVYEKSLPAKVSSPPFPAMQAGLVFRGWSFQKGQVGNEILHSCAVIIEKFFRALLPGAPDGEYVVIQFETSFEKKKSSVETITPMKEKGGRP